MKNDLIGRKAKTLSGVGSVVAIGMKHLDAAMKSFLVLTILFDDGKLETVAERDVQIV
jgi:hypothetical protein